MGFMEFILGLYRENGKENGNYYSRIGYNIMEKKMVSIIFRPRALSCRPRGSWEKAPGILHIFLV